MLSPNLLRVIANQHLGGKLNQKTLVKATRFLPLIVWVYNLRENEILITYRNCVCISHLIKELQNHHSVSILYGEAHLKKFRQQFKAMGFVEGISYKIEVGI